MEAREEVACSTDYWDFNDQLSNRDIEWGVVLQFHNEQLIELNIEWGVVLVIVNKLIWLVCGRDVVGM